MESSLIGPQYHDDQFWKFVESAPAGEPNNFSVAMVPTFRMLNILLILSYLQYVHFHGTKDMVINYEGQDPGPEFLGGAEVISAQL